jgi:hypothetical protein
VLAAVHWDGFGSDQRNCVDEVKRAGLLGDRDDDAATVFGHRDVVRMAAKRHPFDDLAGLSIDDIEGAVSFVADVDSRAVGGEINAMRALDPLALVKFEPQDENNF